MSIETKNCGAESESRLSFTIRSFYTTDSVIPPGVWVVGNFRGNDAGLSDLVQVVQGANHVNYWLANGDGSFRVSSFSPWSHYAMPHGIWLAANFAGNPNGVEDVIHLVKNANYINYWHSNGDGTFRVTEFSPWSHYAVTHGRWLLGRFRDSGNRSIVDMLHVVEDTHTLNYWRSNGDGTFGVSDVVVSPGELPSKSAWLVGRFRPEHPDTDDLLRISEGGSRVQLWASNGDGSFEIQELGSAASAGGRWFAGKFGGSPGIDDWIQIGPDADGEYWRAESSGSRSQATIKLPRKVSPDSQCIVADIDHDGRDELIVVTPGHEYLGVWRWLPDGSFAKSTLARASHWQVPKGDWFFGFFVNGRRTCIFQVAEGADHVNIWVPSSGNPVREA